MFRFLLFISIQVFLFGSLNAQCNQNTNLTYTTVSQSCPAGTVTYNLVYTSVVSNGNNSICYGYTVTSPNGSQQTTNIGPVNQSNSQNTNWSHNFNVTINCDQALTMFINAWSNVNCGGMQCSFPRSQTFFLSPLPIELAYFNGYSRDNSVVLQWQTAKEINNLGFTILHSIDGMDFNEIGFIDGKGMSEAKQDYTFVHPDITGANHFYQLRQVDYDGQTDYSHVIKVNLKSNIENQAQYFIREDQLFISATEKTKILVYNSMGSLLESRSIQVGDTSIPIGHWKKGVYFISDGVHRPVSVINF